MRFFQFSSLFFLILKSVQLDVNHASSRFAVDARKVLFCMMEYACILVQLDSLIQVQIVCNAQQFAHRARMLHAMDAILSVIQALTEFFLVAWENTLIPSNQSASVYFTCMLIYLSNHRIDCPAGCSNCTEGICTECFTGSLPENGDCPSIEHCSAGFYPNNFTCNRIL
jgi:hypothetical protein